MIIFGTPQMEQEFESKLHPEVRKAIQDLDECLGEYKLRITEVGRTDDDSERIYLETAERLMKSNGQGLAPLDLSQYQQIQYLSPQGLKNWARLRASWHKPFCGVDIGLVGTEERLKRLMVDFLTKHCEKPMWELISELHGTGPHIHLARRDYAWLKNFPGSLRSAQGRRLLA